jgi:hypothetical protein
MSQDKPVLDDIIHRLALEAVCPNSLEPGTVFEINMVKTLEEFGHRVTAALERQGAGKWVPLEPTPEMCVAMNREYWRLADRVKENNGTCIYVDEYAVNLYRALLAAAPREHEPPQERPASDSPDLDQMRELLREALDGWRMNLNVCDLLKSREPSQISNEYQRLHAIRDAAIRQKAL